MLRIERDYSQLHNYHHVLSETFTNLHNFTIITMYSQRPLQTFTTSQNFTITNLYSQRPSQTFTTSQNFTITNLYSQRPSQTFTTSQNFTITNLYSQRPSQTFTTSQIFTTSQLPPCTLRDLHRPSQLHKPSQLHNYHHVLSETFTNLHNFTIITMYSQRPSQTFTLRVTYAHKKCKR